MVGHTAPVNGSTRWHQARARAAWVLAGAWSSATLLLAAGIGPHLTDDALTWALLTAPGLAFLTESLVLPRPQIPSRSLWSSPWSNDAPPWPSLARPFLTGVVAAAMTIVAAYLGAGWSITRGATHGAGPLLTGPTPYIDWPLLALGGTISTCLGCVLALVVFLPVGALLDARGAWPSDRPEARRLLAFAGFMLGLLTAAAGLIVADPAQDRWDGDPDPNRVERMLAALHDFGNVLVGGSSQAPVAPTGAWITRAGAGLILASLIGYARTRWKPAK
jgi:hypothetical protein